MRQGRNDGVRPSRMPTGADAEKSHGAGGFPASPTRRRRRPHLDRRQAQEALRINNNNFPPDILQCRPKIKKKPLSSHLSPDQRRRIVVKPSSSHDAIRLGIVDLLFIIPNVPTFQMRGHVAKCKAIFMTVRFSIV